MTAVVPVLYLLAGAAVGSLGGAPFHRAYPTIMRTYALVAALVLSIVAAGRAPLSVCDNTLEP